MKGETTNAAFVHLQVHSCFSFFDSTLTPEEIVHLAAESGAGAVGLTDTNCLTGAVVFYKAALAAGLKPILGAEVRAPFDADRETMRQRTDGAARGSGLRAPPKHLPGEDGDASTSPPLRHGDPSRRMVLLARDFVGYSEISHLITRRMLDAEFDLLAEARRIGPRIVALSDCTQVLEALAARRAGGAYGLLIPSRRRRARNREVYECARRLGLPQAIACDVKMASPDDAPLHDLLQAMRRLTTIHRLGEAERIDPAQHFQAGDSIRAFFGIRGEGGTPLERDLLAAMRNTARIAAECDCRLPLGEWKFPRFKGLSGRPDAMLRELVERGVRERYGTPPPPAATERANRELEVIAKLHFTDYFLLVNRIVDEARERGFFTVGRGSGANSIISYVLGLTGVCPIRHNLYFERFLNPERNAPPDIDIDFSWRERDEIIQWCFDFFGAERVALISTLQTLQMRQAVREVAKAHGIGEAEVNAFNRTREVGYRVESGTEGAQGMQPMRGWGGGFANPAGARQGNGFHDISAEEPWRTIMEQARRIADFPRHLSIHCGGILIAPGEVSDFVPLTRSAKGFVITQMDMYSIEDLGLVKIDLLSNRSLGVLKDGLAMAEKTERERERRGIPAPPPYARLAGGSEGGGSHINSAVFQREAQRIKLAGTRRGTSVALAGVLQAFGGREGRAETTEIAGMETHGTPDGGADALMPCVSLVRQRALDFEHVTNDPATRAMIDSGDTMGCFYIESPGMRALFERLRCRSFQEVVAASSIIRPGVAESGMMQEYITRHKQSRSGSGRLAGGAMPLNAHAKAGERILAKGAAPPHPLMLELLPETYGVMVYQEDVLKVAHDLAGMSFAEADLLRRAMSGKMRSRDAMAQLHDKFIGGAVARGVPEHDALEIWRQVSSFAGYSFCKGHSAAFAVLSYQVSYLKAHFPAEFFAAVLANEGGFYGPGAYIEEARRHGVRTLPPCVNESGVEYAGAGFAMAADTPVSRDKRPSPP